MGLALGRKSSVTLEQRSSERRGRRVVIGAFGVMFVTPGHGT